MKMRSKKGFTIVELVIVIAVIAILAAVMIPTFSGIVGKAKESAAMQEANAAMTTVFAHETEFDTAYNYYFIVDNEYWFMRDGQTLTAVDAEDDAFATGDALYAQSPALPEGFDAIENAGTPAAIADLSSSVVVWKHKNVVPAVTTTVAE